MTGKVIDFLPAGQEKPAQIEAIPETRADQHATAFRRLEPEICDCVRMSHIAEQLLMNRDEAATFAVGHLHEMLRRFMQEYTPPTMAIWEGSAGSRALP